MSGIQRPIFEAINKICGENTVNNNSELELVQEYCSEKSLCCPYDLIEHFKICVIPVIEMFSGEKIFVTERSKTEKQGFILSKINTLFDNLGIPRKCVGAYFEGDYLNILIKG